MRSLITATSMAEQKQSILFPADFFSGVLFVAALMGRQFTASLAVGIQKGKSAHTAHQINHVIDSEAALTP